MGKYEKIKMKNAKKSVKSYFGNLPKLKPFEREKIYRFD